MNFRKPKPEDPEINLIPFIDVLLVVLIFLMLTTTYSKFTELSIVLPTADTDPARDRPQEIIVQISADGRYVVDRKAVDGRSVDAIAAELTAAAGGAADTRDKVVIIAADATAPVQTTINVMDAARRVGLGRITFASQTSQAAAR